MGLIKVGGGGLIDQKWSFSSPHGSYQDIESSDHQGHESHENSRNLPQQIGEGENEATLMKFDKFSKILPPPLSGMTTSPRGGPPPPRLLIAGSSLTLASKQPSSSAASRS